MVEFPVKVTGLFRPHYVTWSEQQQIENNAIPHLRNAIRIIAETGLRVKKELLTMKKDQIDFLSAVLWIPDSKTPNGVAEIPLTKLASTNRLEKGPEKSWNSLFQVLCRFG